MWTLNGIEMVQGDCPAGWSEATAEEIAVYEANRAKQTEIETAKGYLAATDYKMLPDYTVAPDGEPLDLIRAKRATARELIRSLS
jgi:hypothetical protein